MAPLISKMLWICRQMCIRDSPQVAGDGVHFQHGAQTIRGAHGAAHHGHDAVQVFVGVFLVGKAAHQPAAGTADLGGIQGKALLLGQDVYKRQGSPWLRNMPLLQ